MRGHRGLLLHLQPVDVLGKGGTHSLRLGNSKEIDSREEGPFVPGAGGTGGSSKASGETGMSRGKTVQE